jgi:hypothetical protein
MKSHTTAAACACHAEMHFYRRAGPLIKRVQVLSSFLIVCAQSRPLFGTPLSNPLTMSLLGWLQIVLIPGGLDRLVGHLPHRAAATQEKQRSRGGWLWLHLPSILPAEHFILSRQLPIPSAIALDVKRPWQGA